MSNTSNLVLPYLAVGQAQKHVTVNESLRRLDVLVQLSVVSATTTAQPSSPLDGSVFILPPGKTGAEWSSFANGALAYYRDGAWVQLSPREGWLAVVKDADQLLHFDGSAWTLFAPGKMMTLSASDRVLGRITPGAGPAEEIAFTPQAQQLCDDPSFQAMCATLGTWRVLAASAVAVSHTGDTTEHALAAITIPGGAMGPNGVVRVTALFSHTDSANAKTLRCRLGGAGVSGSQVMAVTETTGASATVQRTIQNRASQASQVIGAADNGPVVTTTVDMSADQTLVISGQLANAADALTLDSYLVEIAYGA